MVAMGGAAGDAGAARVHYTTVKPPKVKTGDSGVFPATYRAPILTEPVTDWQCFHSDTISCKDARCHQNPSIAICDILTEADNTQCSDGIDNDLDGFKDCADFNCTQNPFVTVCPVQATPLISLRELSFEACSDNIDNDADKLIDCADPNCKVHAICGGDNTAAFYTPRGIDESRTITCTNKLDDDLDGHTDCADFECQYNPRVDACGSERTLENCFDGKDNDNDGDIDCADSGCAHNPYVKYCEVELVDPGETVFTGDPLTFLNESTFAVCNDEVDNDGDHFVDCNDYQCKNSPRADPACGPQENSFLECTDGKDNDGDNFIDCAEPTCQFSPFFGELVCKNKAQAIHKPVTQSPTTPTMA
jgi:hypothetical protein